MTYDPISQAEIDALFGAAAGPDAALVSLREIADLALSGAWSLAEALLGQPADFTALTAEQVEWAVVAARFGPQVVHGRAALGDLGDAIVIIPEGLAFDLVGLMLGGDQPDALSETDTSALAEIIGQLVMKGLARVAAELGHPVMPSPVDIVAAPEPAAGAGPAQSEPVVLLSHDVTLDSRTSRVGIIVPTGLYRVAAAPPPAAPELAPSGGAPSESHSMTAAQPVQYESHVFPDLGTAAGAGVHRNIDLLMDVPLHVTVELGRTRKQIREVLALGPGAVLELEKLAGEPVDVLVNGKLIAKGEVIVIAEHFGVRITDIVSPAERAASLR